MTGQVNIQASKGAALDVRIEVNPHAYHGHVDPDVYVARFSDANRIPAEGDEVTVIQPDDDPSEDEEFVSTAVVTGIDDQHHLVFLRVDWKGFHPAVPALAPDRQFTVNYQEVRFAIPA